MPTTPLDRVLDIVKIAVVLDYFMCKSRSLFRVYMYDRWETLDAEGDGVLSKALLLGGLGYNGENMARVDYAREWDDGGKNNAKKTKTRRMKKTKKKKGEDIKRRVVFIAWPAMERVGTNDGWYEDPVVVQRRGVVLAKGEEEEEEDEEDEDED